MSWLLHQVANVLELQLQHQYVLKLLKNTQNWNRIKHLYTSGPKLFGLSFWDRRMEPVTISKACIRMATNKIKRIAFCQVVLIKNKQFSFHLGLI